jgi:hypothetical protein
MNENNITKWLLIIVIAVVAITIGLYAYTISSQPVLTEVSLDIQNRQFVALGKRLSRAEVWLVPTGTNITESDYVKYIDLTRSSSDKNNERWVGAIPSQPFLATSVIVKGFDAKGTVVGTQNNPYVGASEVSSVFALFWTR